MPIALDPTATVEFTPESDKLLPEDQQPFFTTRYMTAGDVKRIVQLGRDADATTTAEDEIAVVLAAVKVWFVSCRKVPDRDGKQITTAEGLLDRYTIAELWALTNNARMATTLGEIDRKKSPRQSGSFSGTPIAPSVPLASGASSVVTSATDQAVPPVLTAAEV